VYKYQDACNSEGGNPKVKTGFFKVKLNIKSQLIKLGPTHLVPLKIKVLLKANLMNLVNVSLRTMESLRIKM
jgi:hypothetical protein